jgi:hypothetical protein
MTTNERDRTIVRQWLSRRILHAMIFVILLQSSLAILPPTVACIAMVVILALRFGLLFYRFRGIRRFMAHTRDFVSVWNGRVMLKYDPRLRGKFDPAEVQIEATEALDGLQTFFAAGGPRLRGTIRVPSLEWSLITVYLLPDVKAVSDLFPRAAAVALCAGNAIVVPLTGLPLGVSLRHELTHLFTLRFWNQWIPPLFSEGLAWWLQDPAGRDRLNHQVAQWFEEGHGDLRPLLDQKRFFNAPRIVRSYALAGSFTGYLLQRFGAEAYFALYNRVFDGRDFDREFAETLGVSLASAEAQWRETVMQEDRGYCLR